MSIQRGFGSRGKLIAGLLVLTLILLALAGYIYYEASAFSSLAALGGEVAAAAKEFDQRLAMLFSAVVLVALVSAIIVALILIRSIIAPIEKCAASANSLKLGNLEDVSPTSGTTEAEAIASNLYEFAMGLEGKVDNMLSALSKVLDRTDALRKIARMTAEGSEDQSAQITEVSSTSQELSSSIVDIARNASAASSVAEDAMGVASQGKGLADAAVSTVEGMTTVTGDLGGMVERLHSRVSEIGDIITVIEDIADQTNLLALNAAIEAARAGEQGRGFAVVADEVRKLAERTVRATSEITGKISAVQSESVLTTESMNTAVEQVEKTKSAIANIGGSLSMAEEAVQKVRDEINQIATSVEEQASATEQISSTIEDSSRISSDILREARQVLSEVDNMTGIIDELRASFIGINTRGSKKMILNLAKGDHRLWVNRVGAHINAQARLDVAKLADHTTCRLGKWYYGAGMKACGASERFKALEAPHVMIHSLGKEIVMAYDSGDSEKAMKMFEEMESVSKGIISTLDGLQHDCQR